MAKTRVRYADAPATNDVYFGMLALTAIAMLIGIVVLGLETLEMDADPGIAAVASERGSIKAPALPKAAASAGAPVAPAGN